MASYLFVPPGWSALVWPMVINWGSYSQTYFLVLRCLLFKSIACSSSIYAATKLNVWHMSQMPPRKALLPLIWLKKGKGHATLFSFQPSPARLIKPGFTKKLGVLAPDVNLKENWCVSERKAAGRILSASSHWFSRVGVNQTQPNCSAQWEKINQTAVHSSGENSTSAVHSGN